MSGIAALPMLTRQQCAEKEKEKGASAINLHFKAPLSHDHHILAFKNVSRDQSLNT
jgi:hypothetical protein